MLLKDEEALRYIMHRPENSNTMISLKLFKAFI
jgi:hypothetical protein